MTGLKNIGWGLLSLFAAFCLGTVALSRGETISAFWIVAAAVSMFAIGYRFYSKYIAEYALHRAEFDIGQRVRVRVHVGRLVIEPTG